MKCSDVLDADVQEEKIVILYSSEGSGHKSAADAVERSLHASGDIILGPNKKFSIAKVDILYGLLPKAELFDEYMRTENWPRLRNLVFMQSFAERFISGRQMIWDNKIYNRIMYACDERPPSIIISVFPVANYVYADIARKNKIPMVILPTDYEVSHFLNQFHESKGDVGVYFGLPLNEPEVTAPLYQNSTKPIAPYCITGYPVREEFISLRKKLDASTKPKEIQEYRRNNLKIDDKSKSIMITLGGKGGALSLISQYVEKLRFMQDHYYLGQPLHVIIATGGDQALIEGLKQVHLSNSAHFKTEILGRLDAKNMALTMASVDAVLLKPGGSTVSEAITLGTPMIIKADSTQALPWEKTNMDLVKRLGWGVELALTKNSQVNVNDLIHKVRQVLLADKRVKTPLIDFQTEFPKFIQAILEGHKKTHGPATGPDCIKLPDH